MNNDGLLFEILKEHEHINAFSALTHQSLGFYVGSCIQKEADNIYMTFRWSRVKGSESNLNTIENSIRIKVTTKVKVNRIGATKEVFYIRFRAEAGPFTKKKSGNF